MLFPTLLVSQSGQEGFVHGWQSKQGSNGQTVLDTLFVKLKDPPTCVRIPGLPENIVPVYPTTTNISAMLPNDEKFYISRKQVEVLVNFAMTDFGSQGKSRPWNISDPNNLRSHQSYYTALSRSTTANGTLILQGFDPRVITGGCSGALRQEFRSWNSLTRSLDYAIWESFQQLLTEPLEITSLLPLGNGEVRITYRRVCTHLSDGQNEAPG